MSFCQDIYFDGERQIWRASFTFSSVSPSRIFLAAESGCFQNKFLTVYQKIPVPQWWAQLCSVCLLSFHCVCVCVCVRKSLLQLQGMETGGQMDSMFAGKHAGGTGKLCCLWRTRETNQMWIIFLLFQLLSFAVFSSLASSVTTQRAGLCVCAGKVEGHTCSELTCTHRHKRLAFLFLFFPPTVFCAVTLKLIRLVCHF